MSTDSDWRLRMARDATASRMGVALLAGLARLAAAGGAGTVAIAASRDCTWAASNAPSWITITSATNGQGEGTFTYRVSSNPDPVTRRGTIDVNSISVAVSQEAAPCRYTVTPS